MPHSKSRPNFVFVAIRMSRIREAVAIDYVGGSTCYWAIRKALLPEPVAFLGSIAAPMAIRLALHLWRSRSSRKKARRRLIGPPLRPNPAPNARSTSETSASGKTKGAASSSGALPG